MAAIPSRDRLTALGAVVRNIVAPAMLGVAQRHEDGRVRVVYAYPNVFGAQVIADTHVPEVLRPGGGVRRAGPAELTAHRDGAIELHLLALGIDHVVSLPL